MNWQLVFGIFALTVFALTRLPAAPQPKWAIFAAATVVSVLAGVLVRRFVPDMRVGRCAGTLLLLLLGGLILWERCFPKPWQPEPKPSEYADGWEAWDGWEGCFVAQQAARLEQLAFEDYKALAEQSRIPAERAVFEWLAEEESGHHEAMLSAIAVGASHDIYITREMADALPLWDDLVHGSADGPDAVERAIRCELATARFYRVVAEMSTDPRHRDAFAWLAAAEEKHAEWLRRLREPGKAR